MLPNSLRSPASTSFSLCVLLAGACAQSSALTAQAGGSANRSSEGESDAALAGLPPFLLLVPGGRVDMGLKAEALVDVACQVVNPSRPGSAMKIAESKVVSAIKRSASLLGMKQLDVEPFLLAKWPVKCSEYEVFLQQRRQDGKMRPPFRWWRYGCEANYNEKLPEITKLFPQDKMGPVWYWEKNGPELPYSLQTKDGRSFADQPVTFVDAREAHEFAAWLGMRLPTEAEWTRAARGDGKNLWPWGRTDPTTDVFSEQALRDLKLYNSSDQTLKPVGSVPAGTGPFGHLDMFGQVWQLVSTDGFRPINGPELFSEEWKRLQKDKAGALVKSQPTWEATHVIGKGGAYLSAGDPIQLLLDARVDFQTVDVLESVGFRLAKSLRPGYDLLFSLLRGNYNRAPFAPDQDVDLTAQVGAERYDLGADGFPTAYHAVSLAPVNWLSNDKSADLTKVLEKSQQAPLLVGTFVTTRALVAPAAPAGHYSVLWRKEGMPRELTEAIKAGIKDLSVRKPKNGGDDGGDSDKGKEKKGGWREVLARYGLTDKDLEGQKDAIHFVRVHGMEVSTREDTFLLHGNDGKVIATLPATNKKPAIGNPFASELVFEPSDKGHAVAKFRIGVPLNPQQGKKAVEVHFHVQLEGPVPGGDKPWRLPK